MAKRFTDSDKWDDPWFMELSAKYKLMWMYILDNCTAAGMYKVNIRLAAFQIGEPFEESEVKRVMADRITEIKPGKWFITKFIEYQYGTLSEACKPHQPIIKELKQYQDNEFIRVFIPYPKGIDRVKEKEKEKDPDKEKDP